MFIRFRQTQSTLQATLLVGRRVEGRVRHEQIAALGRVKLPLTIDGRETFWRKLHELLARLGNRITADAQAKIMGEVHSRIPMVTADDRRAHEIGLAEREQQTWSTMQDVLAERAQGMEEVAANAVASAALDRAGADDAKARATDAANRVDRLRRGDNDVPRGQEIDFEKILRDAGCTTALIEHARVLAQLPEEALPTLTKISLAASERASRAAARRMLRKQKGFS